MIKERQVYRSTVNKKSDCTGPTLTNEQTQKKDERRQRPMSKQNRKNRRRPQQRKNTEMNGIHFAVNSLTIDLCGLIVNNLAIYQLSVGLNVESRSVEKQINIAVLFYRGEINIAVLF